MFDGAVGPADGESRQPHPEGAPRRAAKYLSRLPLEQAPPTTETDEAANEEFRAAGGVFDAAAWREQLHRDLDRWLDADVDDGGEGLADAIQGADRLQRAMDGASVTVLSAFDASMQWAAEAHRSPGSWLVAQTGRTRADASSWRRTALDAEKLPAVATAAAEGRLSRAHLRSLASARRAPVEALFDRDQAQLVEAACALTAEALDRHLTRWYHAALDELGVNEPDGPEPPHTDGNRVRCHDLLDGRGRIEADLDPTTYAAVKAGLDREVDRLRRDGALESDPRTLSDVYGDAFADVVARGVGNPEGRRAAPLVTAIVDLDTLLGRARGDGILRTARRAELLGHGPVSDQAIAELLAAANVSLLVTHPTTGLPLWLGRARRLATAAQRIAALAASDGHCSFPGCTVPGHRCDIDHLHGWNTGGSTDIENLAPLCAFHNRLKHRWRLRASRAPDGTIAYTWPNGTPVAPPRYRLHWPGPPGEPDPPSRS